MAPDHRDVPRLEPLAAPGEPAPWAAVEAEVEGPRLRWSVANTGAAARPLWAVHATWDLGPLPDPVQVLAHGWQSWSSTRAVTLGPAAGGPTGPGLLRQMHHADPTPLGPGVARSEWVTVVRVPGRPLECWGFEGGTEHDGTLLLQRDERGHVRLRAVAHLGGAVLAPGEVRPLHGVVRTAGDDHHALLVAWAGSVGRRHAARVTAPYQVGWCSWYHWFTSVTQADVEATVAQAGDWPFAVIQVDDGYQHAIGDWLTTNDTFPAGVAHLASTVARAGRTAGIWLAPPLAMGTSDVATARPDWLARWHDGRPLVGNRNPAWGGDALVLDATRPEVLDHLEHVARELVGMGFAYLKLDFLYAAHVPGTYHDPSRTPAQRVRAVLDAVRRGAGPDAFLLGCGCPLLTAVGLVDGMRIGPDVDPSWAPAARYDGVPAPYRDVLPATRNAWQATLARSWMHRRLWLNDPDCLMLRTDRTAMTPAQVEAWARAVATSGGTAIVSDDVAVLGLAARARLDDVIAMGREVDEASRRGRPPRCDDLLDEAPARVLTGGGHRLTLDDVTAGTTTFGPP